MQPRHTLQLQAERLNKTSRSIRTHVGNSHAMQYDALGHLIQSTDPLTGITKLSYDSHDNLIAVTDANNHMTQYQYDNNNRTTKEIRPLGEALSYAYDNVGNLTSSTDTTGNVINYTYDAANRRTQETHTAAAAANNTNSATSGMNTGLTRTIAYTYNKVGTLTGYTDSNTGHADNQAHSVTYTVDALQRRLTDNITVGGQTISLASTYNANGNKASQTQANAAGNPVTVNYNYDSAQQLKDIILPNNSSSNTNNTNNGGNISITERLFNQASLVLYPGGTVNQLSYDGFGRLAQLKYKSPSQQTLLQRNYQYDPMSNIARVDENKAAGTTTNTNAYLYHYDKLYRLTSADNPSGLPDEQYTYDKLGNRLLDNAKPNPAQANQQWQYNGNNQLTQSATEDTATFGTNSKAVNHSYDGNGNLTELSTELTSASPNNNTNINQTGTAAANPYNNQQYRYDAQNRLTAVTDNQGNLIASYQYDPYGQRIRKTIHRTLNADGNWQALTTPNTFSYFYRDEGLTTQYQTAGQDVTAATPSNITTPKQIAQYGFLPNGVWGTNPIWTNTAKRTTTTVTVNGSNQTQTTISPPDYYYYQNDHLGTPQQLTDQAGNLVWQQMSTAFGEMQVTIGDASNETNNVANSNTNTTPATGVIANPFRFAGQYFDVETNTNYNYHRQYRMAGGGYTQTDPIGLRGGINLYMYTDNSPTMKTDPLGLYSWLAPPLALANYCSDNPSDWSTSIESIDWGDVESRISKKIESMTGGTCTDRMIPVNFVTESQTQGADSKVIGRHNLRIKGKISLSCDCSWKFLGTMASDQGYDGYNFNKSNRDPSSEAQTTGGRNACKGNPFKIFITGSKTLMFSGMSQRGKSTCCK